MTEHQPREKKQSKNKYTNHNQKEETNQKNQKNTKNETTSSQCISRTRMMMPETLMWQPALVEITMHNYVNTV